jgi:outer membrane protein OmpA-like peptidoglycan-associated protein
MKKCILGISLLIFQVNFSFGQQQERDNAKQNQIKRYVVLAEKSFKARDFSRSILYHQKLDSLMPGTPEVKYNLGICYLNSHYKSKALPYLQFAEKAKLENRELDYFLGLAYHHNYLFDSAKREFNQYLLVVQQDTTHESINIADAKRKIQVCDFAKELVQDSVPVDIENIGGHINTSYDEYVPVVSSDQKTMYFTSRRPSELTKKISHDGRHYEDIHMSVKDSVGEWGPSKMMLFPINDTEHDACIGITADAQTLYLYRVKSDAPYNGSIFMSKQKGNTWTKPKKLGTHVNTRMGWEASVSISEDNHKLFFSSDRPGGYGGLDIWYCELQADNEWGPPINLGPTVNTPYHEDCPFIHFDDRTLFFSSEGHKTMGGYDVFSTVLNKDSNTWSSPRNIGFPINSTDDDMYFVYSADGSKGYMSSALRDGGFGGQDIYVVNRPNHSKHMISLDGFILDDESNNPIEASITVTDLDNNHVVGVYSSNSITGKYSLALDFGKNYSVQFEADNFIFHSENININDPEVIFVDHRIFKLKRIKEGNSIVLNNIFFDYNKFDLKSESLPELDKLLDFMKKHPNIYVEIGGFTDSIGNEGYNLKLSRSRANEVYKYLLARGVPKKNMKIQGYGEGKPVASNKTEEGRKLNRRTECHIYNMDAITKKQLDYFTQLESISEDDIVLDEIVPSKKVGEVLYQKVHFLYNNGVHISEDSKLQLEKVCVALNRVPKLKLEIHGSTDKVGSEYNNKDLYEKRVNTVLNYFLDKGFTKDRFVVKSFQPVEDPKLPNLTMGNGEMRKVKFVLSEY